MPSPKELCDIEAKVDMGGMYIHIYAPGDLANEVAAKLKARGIVGTARNNHVSIYNIPNDRYNDALGIVRSIKGISKEIKRPDKMGHSFIYSKTSSITNKPSTLSTGHNTPIGSKASGSDLKSSYSDNKR